MRLKALAEWSQQGKNNGRMLATISDTLELLMTMKRDRQMEEYFAQEQEDEYEL